MTILLLHQRASYVTCQILAVCCGAACILYFPFPSLYCKSLMRREVHTHQKRQSGVRQAILTWSRFDCKNQYPLYLPNTVSHFEVRITLWNHVVLQQGILRGPGNEQDTNILLAFPQVRLPIMQVNVQTW